MRARLRAHSHLGAGATSGQVLLWGSFFWQFARPGTGPGGLELRAEGVLLDMLLERQHRLGKDPGCQHLASSWGGSWGQPGRRTLHGDPGCSRWRSLGPPVLGSRLGQAPLMTSSCTDHHVLFKLKEHVTFIKNVCAALEPGGPDRHPLPREGNDMATWPQVAAASLFWLQTVQVQEHTREVKFLPRDFTERESLGCPVH